ncbi:MULTISPECIES: VF530 family DNA-binding protein [unclassified Colwellia]|uniref:VF530 family protein n=1 Tax=unclassified Colwellia TaxID=196834 RepID=UPI0015F4D337|nr:MULTISPECIES: VF530 family DNA-binding protein [unclassified Colwellia]MBA6378306.1 VF530 family DNA-binding protein [Colwellia sp. BRX10-7]MBA6386277.1 VF530 family DNA-binding protein [Colwellia sp. BRX10-2]MBA6400460.1 VF530 family DNA-binding protein [Colwellia sp. BRX10-5]MBA6405069.1 VF530 family DNA-binding protein [Colwellia sp. BRX10-1]
MTLEDEQLNNPLHGLKLDTLLNEVYDHYGWEILAEYTNINCFKNKPSIESSLKFLRKTEWAREKMERFYLYQFKNLPKADDEQYEIPPRLRVIPARQKPKDPAVLILGRAPIPTIRSSNFSDNKPSSQGRDSRSNSSKGSYKDKSEQGFARRTEKPERSKPASASSNPYSDSPK